MLSGAALMERPDLSPPKKVVNENFKAMWHGPCRYSLKTFLKTSKNVVEAYTWKFWARFQTFFKNVLEYRWVKSFQGAEFDLPFIPDSLSLIFKQKIPIWRYQSLTILFLSCEFSNWFRTNGRASRTSFGLSRALSKNAAIPDLWGIEPVSIPWQDFQKLRLHKNFDRSEKSKCGPLKGNPR